MTATAAADHFLLIPAVIAMVQVHDLTGECPAGCSHTHAEVAEAKPKPSRGRKRKADVKTDDSDCCKGKGKPKAKKPVPEKRVNAAGKVVRYCKAPPQATRERIVRALPGSGHRMFLLSRKTVHPPGSEAGAKEDFDILGATGNVYKVTISKSPTCTCPDAVRRNDLCKHILYVMIRVLRLAQDDHLVFQRGLLVEEANEVLSGQRSQRVIDNDVMADSAVLEAHKRMCSGAKDAIGVGSSGSADGLAPGQRPIEGDCPICYDELHASSAQQDTIVFCKSCGNNVHKECFQRWSTAKQGMGVTCVWCRASWPKDTAPESMGPEYVNLRDHSVHYSPSDTSHSALYGSTSAAWIAAHAGQISARQAANMARAASGRA